MEQLDQWLIATLQPGNDWLIATFGENAHEAAVILGLPLLIVLWWGMGRLVRSGSLWADVVGGAGLLFGVWVLPAPWNILPVCAILLVLYIRHSQVRTQ